MFLVQPEIFQSNPSRTAPRLRIDRIAMGENGGIQFLDRNRKRLLDACQAIKTSDSQESVVTLAMKAGIADHPPSTEVLLRT